MWLQHDMPFVIRKHLQRFSWQNHQRKNGEKTVFFPSNNETDYSLIIKKYLTTNDHLKIIKKINAFINKKGFPPPLIQIYVKVMCFGIFFIWRVEKRVFPLRRWVLEAHRNDHPSTSGESVTYNCLTGNAYTLETILMLYSMYWEVLWSSF